MCDVFSENAKSGKNMGDERPLGRYEIKGELSERKKDEKIKKYFDRRGGSGKNS
jgi:hypothetical protein